MYEQMKEQLSFALSPGAHFTYGTFICIGSSLKWAGGLLLAA